MRPERRKHDSLRRLLRAPNSGPIGLTFISNAFTAAHVWRTYNVLVPERCGWAREERMIAYHDTEWGVPVHDERALFEFLVLEGAQAGLSWSTILNKRDHYRKAFDRFDPRKVARYDERRLAALLEDPGIVRNRLKVAAAVRNDNAFLSVQKEFG